MNCGTLWSPLLLYFLFSFLNIFKLLKSNFLNYKLFVPWWIINNMYVLLIKFNWLFDLPRAVMYIFTFENLSVHHHSVFHAFYTCINVTMCAAIPFSVRISPRWIVEAPVWGYPPPFTTYLPNIVHYFLRHPIRMSFVENNFP